jgi:hypothetical protein
LASGLAVWVDWSPSAGSSLLWSKDAVSGLTFDKLNHFLDIPIAEKYDEYLDDYDILEDQRRQVPFIKCLITKEVISGKF